ncbi:E3 ubiquitin-protein ligase ZFP91 isoform X2 [Pleurodeles waltl]|uniref:E3 ubiquitin-protein ligase ZFP91 isoform X2 n=1 Tax=Pleurodeles waltl TaxID=8319 RepID=UPI0037094CA6
MSGGAGATQAVRSLRDTRPGGEHCGEELLVEETGGGRCRVLRRGRTPLPPPGGSVSRRRKAECPRRRRRGAGKVALLPDMEEEEDEEEEEEEQAALVVQEDNEEEEGPVMPQDALDQQRQRLMYVEKDESPQRDVKDSDLPVIGISDEEELLISEEETPFKDDPRDETYKPHLQRDPPKPRRKFGKGKDEKEIKVEIEVKEEENALREVEDLPRKRGRRRKDDKTPRLPKRRKKPPIQYVRCEMEGCGTVLAHPRYLQHHIKYQHLLKKKYVCPHPSCGRLFRLQKQLLRHAKHHTDQRDYICEYCARAFKSSHNLAVHRMIHTGEKPLQCEICGFTCRQKASLNWHMKKHDADSFYQFSCNICGKKFEKKDSVVAHKAKSHPEVLIAEALAANAGALITSTDILASNPESIAPTTDSQGLSLLPGTGDVYCSPMDRMNLANDGKMLMGSGSNMEGLVMNTGILGATTEVLIEDSADSAGP